MFTPTNQQVICNGYIETGDNVVVQAGAGSGKSSSLRYFAAQNPDKTFLVLCFNKANSEESNNHPDKPDNIFYSTIHSVAYRVVVDKAMREKLSNYLNYRDIPVIKYKVLGLLADAEGKVEEKTWENGITGCILEIITNYCRSDSRNLYAFALEYLTEWFGEGFRTLNDGSDIAIKIDLPTLSIEKIQKLADLIRNHWLNIIDVGTDYSITHDVYLKLYHLWEVNLSSYYDKVNRCEYDVDVLCLDEAQDSNPVIIGIFNNSTIKQKVIVGDGMQCVIKGTLVNGKPIEDIEIGDYIPTAVAGKIVSSKVTHKFSRQIDDTVFTIKTALGKCLTTTKYHTHFAIYPEKVDSFVVYLMYKEGLGYRIGLTKDFRQRCKGEIADSLWVLKVFEKDWEEARLYETITSYNYKIPETIFQNSRRKDILELNQGALDIIHRTIDSTTGALQLLSDLGLDIQHPHYQPTKSLSEQMRVTITLMGDVKNKYKPGHRYSVYLADEYADKFQAKFPYYNVRATTKSDLSRRVEGVSLDMSVGYKLWEDIKETFPNARLKELANIADGPSLEFIPALNLLVGMKVLVLQGGKLVLDTITEISKSTGKHTVYDINVARTHNFIANDIVTHNCIYSWRGGMNAMSLFPEYTQGQLTESFRFNNNIAKIANRILAIADAPIRVTGSNTQTCITTKAHLFRTNSQLLQAIFAYAEAGYTRIFTTADLTDLFSKLYHLQSVAFNTVPKYPNKSLRYIMTYDSLKDAMEINSELRNLTNLAKVISTRSGSLSKGINKIKSLLTDREKDASITLTTIHKAKGMEWSEVTITDKLVEARNNEDILTATKDWLSIYENQCLLYVAITRAKVKINLPDYMIEVLENYDE